MLKIGDFSRLCNISIRMLRYYDQNNILKPSYVDEVSGYRFYESGQIYKAYKINYLKKLGFGTAIMKEMLQDQFDETKLKGYFRIRLAELVEEQQRINGLILRLQNADTMLKGEELFMNYQVEVKDIEGVDVIGKRGLIPNYEREDLLWKGMFSEIEEKNLQIPFANKPSRAYFFDEGYKEKDVDVEVCAAVSGKFKESDHLKFSHKNTQTCACVTFEGSYNQLMEISFTIGTWINDKGYELDGPNFCIYHKGYSETNNQDEFVTEVCFPICK